MAEASNLCVANVGSVQKGQKVEEAQLWTLLFSHILAKGGAYDRNIPMGEASSQASKEACGPVCRR